MILMPDRSTPSISRSNRYSHQAYPYPFLKELMSTARIPTATDCLLLLKPIEQSMGLCGRHWHHHCRRRVFLSKRLAQTRPFSFRSCRDPLRVRLGQDFTGAESNDHVRSRSENLLSYHGWQFL